MYQYLTRGRNYELKLTLFGFLCKRVPELSPLSILCRLSHGSKTSVKAPYVNLLGQTQQVLNIPLCVNAYTLGQSTGTIHPTLSSLRDLAQAASSS